MYRKSEHTIIKDHGNKIGKIFMLISGILIICLVMAKLSFGQDYFLNTYWPSDDTSQLSYNVNVAVIDLNLKSVVNNSPISETGTILNKIPMKINRNGNLFLISFSLDGAYAKNSGVTSNGTVLNYSVHEYSNGRLDLVRSDGIVGASIELLEQVPNENGFRLSAILDSDTSHIFRTGLYTLNRNNQLGFINNVSLEEIPGSIGNLNGFGLLRKVWGSASYHLYHSFHNTQYWLIKINNNMDAIVDSVQLRQSGGQATIYAYHPGRDKFYCFHLNYEMHGKYINKNREDYYIQPEVLIYDPQTLDLVHQYPIADYPDGNYPGRENGLADVVGDYILYYFFQDDWMGIYAPAMLFIFDTRTNEATWLRVGWR